MNKNELPSISVVVPTLNSGSVLEKCLRSISIQDYPKDKIEVIIADGGSTDQTLTISKKYHAKIVNNSLKTGEAGKAIGVKTAKNDLIALVDSDNILPNDHWFRDLVFPFEDKEIIVSEPIKYTYRKNDPYLTRYFALLGMNDPICLFIGNYDRFSYITNKWTGLRFPEENREKYLKVTLNHEPIPTIGANGTLFRREVLQDAIEDSNYLFDIDILIKLIRAKGSVKIAKVKTGIIHTFVEADAGKFFRKQLRRMNDMSFHKSKKNREISWEGSFLPKIFLFITECLFIFPILIQMLVGFLRKPDIAWLFHPIACYSTLFIYTFAWLKGKVIPHESSRANWKQ
ncbi:glycosyltransferase [bacterium]|nr:MAG: glycosyltransferase [bacterium]